MTTTHLSIMGPVESIRKHCPKLSKFFCLTAKPESGKLMIRSGRFSSDHARVHVSVCHESRCWPKSFPSPTRFRVWKGSGFWVCFHAPACRRPSVICRISCSRPWYCRRSKMLQIELGCLSQTLGLFCWRLDPTQCSDLPCTQYMRFSESRGPANVGQTHR